MPGLSWFFIIALIPGLLIGLVLSYAIYQNERSSLEQGAQQTARALLSAIDAELIKAQYTAVALSKSESLMTRNLGAFYRQAGEVAAAIGQDNNFVLSDVQGWQVLNTARPLTDTLPRHGNPEQIHRVTQTGLPAISNLYTGAVLKRPLVSIDVPVTHEGKLVYVLSVGLLPEQFNKLLAEQKLPDGWLATVLDAQDTVVARNLSPAKMIARKATDDLRQQIASHGRGTMASRSLEGNPTFLAYEKSSTTGWTVVVGMTKDVLYRDLYRLLTLVALSLAGFIGSGLVLAWLFSSHVRHALKALGAAADAAAQQAQDVHAPTTSGIHEIDRLAGQFNAMHEAQQQLEVKIRQMAFHDPLTSLANRRLLVDHLHQAMAGNKRTGRRGALIFLDLDNFKPLNDSQGHAVGDLLLIEVAARLKQSVREVDTVARFGGDEFVVLVMDLDSDETIAASEAMQIAEKIRARLAEPYILPIQSAGQPDTVVEHHCTASVGVALFDAREADFDQILDLADATMFEAKKAGRNRVHLATPTPAH